MVHNHIFIERIQHIKLCGIPERITDGPRSTLAKNAIREINIPPLLVANLLLRDLTKVREAERKKALAARSFAHVAGVNALVASKSNGRKVGVVLKLRRQIVFTVQD